MWTYFFSKNEYYILFHIHLIAIVVTSSCSLDKGRLTLMQNYNTENRGSVF